MVKKVFDRIFKTIQIVINAVMAVFSATIAFSSLAANYLGSDTLGLMALCIIGTVGFNILNIYIRKLIKEY